MGSNQGWEILKVIQIDPWNLREALLLMPPVQYSMCSIYLGIVFVPNPDFASLSDLFDPILV